jgi:uncharacterized protein (TIGR03382 family)
VSVAVRSLVVVVLLPLSAHAGVIWSSDFETQDLSSWDNYVLHANHWYFPTTPTPRSGTYLARAELHTEDTYGSFQRVEVEYSAPLQGFEGSDLYYAWSAQLDSAAPFLPMDHEIAFWESTGGSVYHQMIGLHVNASSNPARVSLSTDPEDGNWAEQFHASMTADVWHDFVLHVKWSLDPTVGFVEFWYDGAQVVQKVHMRTMVSSNGPTSMTGGLVTAFHTGILLSPIQNNKPVEIVYLDRYKIGTALSDVVDTTPVPDAGNPTPDAGASHDAGTAMHDAGTAMPDAGKPDAGASSTPDAGSETSDAGTAPPDAGVPQSGADAGEGDMGVTGSMGCGCDGAPQLAPLLALVGLALGRARRRRT